MMAAASPVTLMAWGGKGHQAVAQVAQNHLTDKAKKALNKYLEGRTVVDATSDADVYRPVWLRRMGAPIINPDTFRLSGWTDFDYDMPSEIEPWTHSFCINDETGKCLKTDLLKVGNKYEGMNNCVLYIDRFTREIEQGVDKMRPDSLMIKLCLMIHWLGDMHCPMHIQYYPNDMNKGGNVYYKGEKLSLHTFWDSTIFTEEFSGKSAADIAKEAETFEPADFNAITAGDIWDWGPACAAQARPGRMLNGVRIGKNAELPDDFSKTVKPICLRQIRDGGFRLAALLNRLFD